MPLLVALVALVAFYSSLGMVLNVVTFSGAPSQWLLFCIRNPRGVVERKGGTGFVA